MPLITHTPSPIVVEVSDRKINDTVIKQKVVFQRLEHRIQTDGTSRVGVSILVELYAANGTAYGEKLTGNGFNSYYDELVADNNTIVDVQTGDILAINVIAFGYKNQPDWIQQANDFKQDVMFQGDFFEVMRDSQPVQIGALIRHHITQADAMGKFK